MHFDGEFTELRCHKLDIACQPFCCHHWEADCFASPHLTTPHNARVLKLTELSSLFVVAGFSSLFLYRRWYRCHVVLDSFAMDKGVIDRREHLSLKDFQAFYDGKKPVRFLVSSWSSLWMSSCYVVSSRSHKTSVLLPHHHHHHHHHQVVLNM